MSIERLEPCEGKLSCTVLRGPERVTARAYPVRNGMAHELVWRVSDRVTLERRFQIMFARSERRDWAAARLVEKFIEDVTLYPLEWPVSDKPPSNDEWRFGGVTVRFRRYPSDQLIEVLEIQAASKAEPSAAPNGGPATQPGNSGVTEGPPSVS